MVAWRPSFGAAVRLSVRSALYLPPNHAVHPRSAMPQDHVGDRFANDPFGNGGFQTMQPPGGWPSDLHHVRLPHLETAPTKVIASRSRIAVPRRRNPCSGRPATRRVRTVSSSSSRGDPDHLGDPDRPAAVVE